MPSNQSEDTQSTPVPPPPTPSAKKVPQKRNKKKLIVIGAVAAVALALGGTVVGITVSNNSEKLDEYDTVLVATKDASREAKNALKTATAIEPELQELLEGQVSEATALTTADRPSVLSSDIDARTGELKGIRSDLVENREELQSAIGERSDYMVLVREAKGTVKEAKQLLKDTKGKVKDKKKRESLSAQVKTLEDSIEAGPDASSASSYASTASAIEEIQSDISESSELVSTSHEDWKAAEEAAAKKDPANYNNISDRDWQLVERSPFGHYGDKYVVYGAVTQADSNTGVLAIRVDTSGSKKSRKYSYDVNTYVNSGSFGMFSDIVQGDHVKMLVEVSGSKSYSTVMGGTMSAVEVTAYDIEVIGQF